MVFAFFILLEQNALWRKNLNVDFDMAVVFGYKNSPNCSTDLNSMNIFENINED